MMLNSSRSRVTTVPLGKAARATRVVSAGISPIGSGRRLMIASTSATAARDFPDRWTARQRAPSWRGNGGLRWPGTADAPPLCPVAVRRPNDTGCVNPARQIGPRRSPASSFVAAVPGEHEQQYLTSPAAWRPTSLPPDGRGPMEGLLEGCAGLDADQARVDCCVLISAPA